VELPYIAQVVKNTPHPFLMIKETELANGLGLTRQEIARYRLPEYVTIGRYRQIFWTDKGVRMLEDKLGVVAEVENNEGPKLGDRAPVFRT